MSNMKNGFSTLNRWLGKKNKDKATPNGKLSKSSTNLNLSVSSTNINETSQLEYNRITPLPVVTSNAPFEQTFRITVLLPKDQLYVARLGARVPLSKLLELVCENKQLDSQKYEFRNPVDPSQIYSCDLTIGAVGLSEVRLCHKSEAYDNFNADEVIKLHRTSIIRDSLSSSELSSRNSKHTTKTASPYSSSNSLNSMDSTGMNYTRTPVGPPTTINTNTSPKVVMAPPRKKRAAPRPPSQTAIPERSALIITNGNQTPKTELNGNASSETMPTRKDFYVSAPNLASSTMISQSSLSIDCNGNSKINQNNNDINIAENEEKQCNGTQLQEKNARNLYSGSVQNLSSDIDASTQKFPEPSPRKRILQLKKKAAPAPPPRGSGYFDDSLSIHSNSPLTPETPDTSTTATADTPTKFNTSAIQNAPINTVTAAVPEVPATAATNDIPTTPAISELHLTESSLSQMSPASSPIRQTPQPLTRETVSKSLNASVTDLRLEISDSEISPTKAVSPQAVPKPVPRITTAIVNEEPECKEVTQPNNVSKVMLNRTPTPEPRSLSTEPPLSDINAPITEDNNLLNGHHNIDDDDNISKQADSGIGEPVPSPIPDSLPSESSAIDGKLSTFESSSDDDDMVKVYNFKLGKTLFQQLDEQQVSLEDEHMHSVTEPDSIEHTPSKITMDGSSTLSDSGSWNFQIPISPPPNFADTAKHAAENSDTPITPNIKERPVLDFHKIGADDVKMANSNADKVIPLPSPQNPPMNDIVDELSAIISEQRMNTLIKKAEETNEIKAAKPSTLSNFSIASIAQQPTKSAETEPKVSENLVTTPSSPESVSDEEKLYRKRGSITSSTNILKQRRSVTRADSFHATMQQSSITSISQQVMDSPDGLNTRSASYLSLTKIDQNALNLQRRRSSSELSIGESPSLQSLEIIKTILNSRKNSLNNSGSDSESKCASAELSNRVEPVNLAEVTETSPKSAPEQVQADIETIAKSAEPVEKPAKEIPKVYRYSGPPSINFSTWSERPKVQVAIKNEGDYIFGGTNASNQNAAVTTAAMEISNVQSSRNYRASMPTEDFRDFKFRTQRKPIQSEELKQKLQNVEESANSNEIEPKTVTTFMRLGIPEKEFKVPITVKPLQDVAVESVQLRSEANTKLSTATTTKSFASTNLNMNGRCSTSPAVTKPVDTMTPRPLTQCTNTATLPRSIGNTRFSMPATGPTLLRSTSITQLEANKPKSTTAPVENVPAPFGQNTLRKTGYKEKMLAKEAAEEAKRNSVNQSLEASTKPTIGTQLSQDSSQNAKSTHNFTQSQNQTQTHGILLAQKSPLKTLQSAKLELKLQKSTSVYVNQSSSPVIPTAPNAPNSAPVAPAPPPPPSFKSVARKPQLNGSAPSTPTIEPRDQLLEAIRNFKREELNRS